MRRQYLTHPSFQYSFTFSFVLGTLVILLLIGGASIGTLFLLARDSSLNPEQQVVVLAGFRAMIFLVLKIGLPILFLFGILGFYLSYKFVGPLLRIERWLQQNLDHTEISKLTLRPGDELHSTIEILNHLLPKIKARNPRG